MKGYAAVIFAGIPCQAQFLQKLEQGLLGGQGQTQGIAAPGQPAPASLIGNVNLPPGQYTLTNVQSGQGMVVVGEKGQLYVTGQPLATVMVARGKRIAQRQGGLG